MSNINLRKGFADTKPESTQYTDVEILREIRYVADKVDANPTADEFNTHSRSMSHTTASERFGSWVNAKEYAGVGGNINDVNVNSGYFETIDTHEKAYYLGLILADGSIYTGTKGSQFKIELQKHDGDIIRQFKSDIESGHKIREIESTKERHSNRISLSIANRKFCEHLIEHGIVQNKSKHDTMPDIESEYRPAFIRGLFDGDGHIGSVSDYDTLRVTWRITNNSEKRLRTLSDWIHKMGIDSVCIRQANSGAYTLKVSSRDNVQRLWRVLYPFGVDTEPAIQRKLNTMNKISTEIKA